MPNVPNNESFSLLDVYNSVYGHQSATQTNLSSCFTYAVAGYFDTTYNNDLYAPANSQKRFRNYTPSSSPATISMSLTLTSHTLAGVYNYTGVLTVVSPIAQTIGAIFELDFLSGSVPSGQSEARQATIYIPLFPITKVGAGTITSYTQSYSAGTTNVNFSLVINNDNWDDPAPVSSYRIRLMAGVNATLSVPNSTVTNATTYVSNITGVTTAHLTIVSAAGIYAPVSGHMIYYGIHRNTLPLGGSYTALLYKDAIIREVFTTTTYNANRRFIRTPFVDIGSGGPYTNYMTSSYTDGTDINVSLNVVTSSFWLSRYTLLNHSGSTSTYTYSLQPYKYCDFTPESYSQSIDSFIPGAHILKIDSFSGYNDYFPRDLTIIPGTANLSEGEKYTYKYVAHCPTGGFIRIYINNVGTDVDLYDGDSYDMWSGWIPGQEWDFLFVLNNTTKAKTTLGMDGVDRQDRRVRFQQTDQWLELVATSSNVTTHTNYPHKIGYYGVIS